METTGGSAPLLAGAPPPRFGHRHRMLCILAMCNLCLYLNRANISVAITFMYVDECAAPDGARAPLVDQCAAITDSKQCVIASSGGAAGGAHCAWHDYSTDRSNVLAAFYWGYMLSQIPAGWWASAVGGKRVLTAAVCAWSVATALTTPAAAWLPALVVSRIVVGAAEGLNYPAQVVLNAQWVPEAERSRAWSFVSSGESAGTVLAMLVCPFMAHTLGWGSIFWMSAVVGALWLGVFHKYCSATPEEALRSLDARADQAKKATAGGGRGRGRGRVLWRRSARRWTRSCASSPRTAAS
jgi:hypothetical protein